MENVERIPLSNGTEAIVDRADALLVSGFNWGPIADGYVGAWRGHLLLYLHRLIAGAGPDELVDHANRDPLDCRSCNLRIASHSQNGANRGADRRKAGTTSRHKGVSWNSARQRWVVYVHVDGRTQFVGRFTDENEAAAAYNAAAVRAWGEFARLNDVEGATQCR